MCVFLCTVVLNFLLYFAKNDKNKDNQSLHEPMFLWRYKLPKIAIGKYFLQTTSKVTQVYLELELSLCKHLLSVKSQQEITNM